MARKIAIFYAMMTAGHRAAAEALSEWCSAEYPGSEVLCRDLLDYVPHWVRRVVESSYLSMTRSAPSAWRRLYRSTDRVSGKRWTTAFWNDLHKNVSRTYIGNLFKELDAFDPDALLVTHFFGMSALLDKWEHRTPIYYVCTDYLSHAIQRDPRFDGWFVGSEEAMRQYRADSIPGAEFRVKNLGIPIGRDYLLAGDRAKARETLNIPAETTTVLLLGGGIGTSALGVAADSLIDRTDWRVEIVCGDNGKMLEALRDKYYPFKHIRVQGFVENMRTYYDASDVVVLKPAGISAAEATSIGALLLLLDPLPGLERYNCDYLLENGAARRVYESRRLDEQIVDLLADPDEVERMRSDASGVSRPLAARDILSFVMQQLDEREAEKAEKAAEPEQS